MSLIKILTIEKTKGYSHMQQEISPNDPRNYLAKKRSIMTVALIYTFPGIPMIFQGQEFNAGSWYNDMLLIDWDNYNEAQSISLLFQNLKNLRLNKDGLTKGLSGQFSQLYHQNDSSKIIAFHHWDKGGPADDVVVVANFSQYMQVNYIIGFPAQETWNLRFSSDCNSYNNRLYSHPSIKIDAKTKPYDGFPYSAEISIGPYSFLIYSQ